MNATTKNTKTIKITAKLRNKYPTLNDEQIAHVIAWNRHYNKVCIKEVCQKIILGTLWTLIGTLSIIAVASIVMMFINCM